MLHLDPKDLKKGDPKIVQRCADGVEPLSEVKKTPLVKPEPVLRSLDRNAESCQPFLSSVKKGFLNKVVKKVDVGIDNIFFDYKPFDDILTYDPTSVSPIAVCQDDKSLDFDLVCRCNWDGWPEVSDDEETTRVQDPSPKLEQNKPDLAGFNLDCKDGRHCKNK